MNLHQKRARQLAHAGLLGYRIAPVSTRADWAEAILAGAVTLVAMVAWCAVIWSLLG